MDFIIRQKISWKLIALVGLMLIPVLVLGVLFVLAENRQIAATQDKINSLEYLTPLRNLLDHATQHRSLATRAMAGDTASRSNLVGLEPQIDADLKKIDETEQQFSKTKATTQGLGDIKAAWSDLKSRGTSGTMREVADAHNKLINLILTQIRVVGDVAIVTDPELDTYYLGNSMVTQIPGTIQSLGELSAYGSVVAARGKLVDEDRFTMTGLIDNVNRFSSRIRVSIDTAVSQNSTLTNTVGSKSNAAAAAITLFVRANEDMIKGGNVRVDSEYYALANSATNQTLTLFDELVNAYRVGQSIRIENLKKDRTIQIGIAAIALLIAFYLAFTVSRSVTQQITAISELFAQIGIGNLSARAEVISPDELGNMAQSLNAMLDGTLSLIQSREERDRIQQSIQKLLEEMSGVAEGDLTKEAEVTPEITGAIADSFNFMITELRRIISTVQDTTLQVSSSANQVQATAEHLAQGSEAQAMQIVEASAAIDEMAVSIQQVSSNAATAAGVAEQGLKSAKNGTESVQKTIAGMNAIRQQVQQTAKRIKRLGESSQEIGEIVQLIGDIADRTSILALNASIQAAMAGEAGKGFAVVAEEVERLSERSTEATKRIATLIKSIQSDTNEAIAAMEETTREVVGGSNLANTAGQALAEIESVSNQLADLIQSISMASKQQARGSDSVAKSMAEISEVTQQTAAGAKEAAVSIKNLAELADDLRTSLERFKMPSNVRETTPSLTGRWLTVAPR